MPSAGNQAAGADKSPFSAQSQKHLKKWRNAGRWGQAGGKPAAKEAAKKDGQQSRETGNNADGPHTPAAEKSQS